MGARRHYNGNPRTGHRTVRRGSHGCPRLPRFRHIPFGASSGIASRTVSHRCSALCRGRGRVLPVRSPGRAASLPLRLVPERGMDRLSATLTAGTSPKRDRLCNQSGRKPRSGQHSAYRRIAGRIVRNPRAGCQRGPQHGQPAHHRTSAFGYRSRNQPCNRMEHSQRQHPSRRVRRHATICLPLEHRPARQLAARHRPRKLPAVRNRCEPMQGRTRVYHTEP